MMATQGHPQDQLKTENNMLRITLDSIGDAVIATDLAGCIVEINPAAEALTGWEKAQTLGKPLSEVFNIVNAQTGEPAPNPVARVLEMGKTVGLANHTQLIAKDGAEYQIADSAAPIRDAGGQTQGVVLVFRDVTKDYKMREALRESEERIQRAIHEAPFPAMIHAEDGEVLLVNNRWTQVTGYPQEEISTLGAWTEKAYGERQDAVREVIDALYEAQGYTDEGDFTITCRDGSTRIWSFSSTPLGPDGAGRRLALSMAVDITDRVQAEATLRESEEKYRTLVNSTLQGVVIAKPDPIRLVFANPAMAQISGYPPERLVGMAQDDLVKLIHEEDWGQFFDSFQKQLQGEDIPESSECRLVTKAGAVKWVALYSSRIEYQNEAATLMTFMDITKRKRAEEDLRQLKDQLQEEVAQKTQELQERVEILERFHDATIERELRMKELRDEIARLKGETG
jgi:PAS domain S-box-containing protein